MNAKHKIEKCFTMTYEPKLNENKLTSGKFNFVSMSMFYYIAKRERFTNVAKYLTTWQRHFV